MIDGELGLPNLRAALRDLGCVKGAYINELLEAEDAICGTPGCLTCPLAGPGESPASGLRRRATHPSWTSSGSATADGRQGDETLPRDPVLAVGFDEYVAG